VPAGTGVAGVYPERVTERMTGEAMGSTESTAR
jgi:hypothetical protein